MRLTTFTFLTVLALLYAGLTLAETAMYQTWDKSMMQQKDIQNKVVYFNRLTGFIEQLLRRLAIESQHDPAIAELLKQHRIKVVVTPMAEKDAPGGGSASPVATPSDVSIVPGSAAVAPVAPNKLPQSSPGSDATHP